MEIMLTGRRFTAAELLSRGVLNQVVPDDRVETTAAALAAEIAQKSPLAVQTIKEAALTLYDLSTAEAFAREAALGQRTFTSDHAKQTLKRFAASGEKKVAD